jgi:hypothetical protein
MVAVKYSPAVRVRKAWKDPSHWTKYPVPMVLTMAATVPMPFVIPVHAAEEKSVARLEIETTGI